MLSIESDTRDVEKPKPFQIFIEERFSDSLYDIDHTDVTTVIDSVSETVEPLTSRINQVLDFKFINLD
jgi:hypothetical protein